MVATLSKLPTKLLSEVKDFLSQSPLKFFINGEWVGSHGGQSFATLNPGSAALLAEVHAGDKADIDRAVEAAQNAFRNSGWAQMSAKERGVYLHRFADLIEKNKPILAQLESLDCGKIHAQAEGDMDMVVATFRYFTDLALHVKSREPIPVAGHEVYSSLQPFGVCGFIFPWNFPLLLVGWGTAPALAAGSVVVIKPAEDTPLSALYFAKLAKEAGIPDGVINVVNGFGETAGAALAAHPGLKRMSFTGSPEVGKLVARSCGENLVPVKLELGGKGAAVVFDDTDVEATAQKLTQAVTFHSGQVCCTATRWIVQEKIYDRFLELSRQNMAAIKIGHESVEGSQMGPVVSEKQRNRVLSYLEEGTKQGAEFVVEGGPAVVSGLEKGFFVKPAMLTGDPDNVACREEIFGPVTFVMPFKDEEQAVDLVNRSNYGLANSVWTSDLERARRVAESMVAGNSWVNAHNVFAMGIPYAGINLSGAGGGVNCPATFYDYLRPQSIVRPL